MITRTKKWESKRNTLAHDCLAVLRRNLGIVGLTQEEESGLLEKWGEVERKTEALLGEAEESLSPRQRLEEGPLSHAPDDTKLWIGDLICDLWHKRSRVRGRLRVSTCALQRARRAHRGFIETPADGPDLAKHQAAFQNACANLEMALYELKAPEEVHVR
jgi:hypothetical protein